jgi:Do/DeqQ family serine protease
MNPKKFFQSKAVLIVAVAVMGLAVGFFGGRVLTRSSSNSPEPEDLVYSQEPAEAGEGFQTMNDIQAAFRQVAREVLPSVVEIDVVNVVKAELPGVSSPFDFFFGGSDNSNGQPQQREFRQQGLGSGVLVKRAGQNVYVLTNNHVVGEAEEITVKLSDGRSYTAKLVGKDPKKDLALVTFTTEDSVPLAELGDSDSLQVGDWVLAVGSPLGFHSTVTEGIVSAVGRESLPGSSIASFTDYIQTDAAINQGNSGGALVDIQGRVVGINSWIASPSGGNVGLGFAIPINNAKSTIQDLITKGRASYGWLGINMGTLSPEEADNLYGDEIQGAFVSGVYQGSPAQQAGILSGDTITAVNGEDITDSTQLLLVVGNLEPGTMADFTVLRGHRQLHLQVNIAERQEEQALAEQAKRLWPGLSVVQITPELRSRLELPRNTGNVIVGSVVSGSPAGVAGLRVGDILRKANDQKLASLADFYHAVNEPDSKQLMLEISRQGSEFQIGLVK